MEARLPGAERSSIERPEGKSLIVAMPALDEEATVEDVIRRIPHEIRGIRSVEVVVIDDGSRDRTADKAEQAGATIIRHASPRGVGAAFRSALAYGIDRGADLIATIDADGQFDPADIPVLIEPILRGEADFATASRFKDPDLVPTMPRTKLWGNRMMSRLISRLAGQTFYDVSCGMRCYSRSAALQLHPLGRFTYTQETLLNLAFKQLRIAEVPIVVRGERAHGHSRVASNLWRYAVQSMQIILRCYRDYHPLRFFGGIALALMLPAAGLGAFLLVHYLTNGAFTPYKWAGFAAAALTVLAVLMVHLGLIGDMMNRHRIYLEELLYRERVDAGQPERDE
jgi:glycosyltransferase involved in cell wall biosynthesis